MKTSWTGAVVVVATGPWVATGIRGGDWGQGWRLGPEAATGPVAATGVRGGDWARGGDYTWSSSRQRQKSFLLYGVHTGLGPLLKGALGLFHCYEIAAQPGTGYSPLCKIKPVLMANYLLRLHAGFLLGILFYPEDAGDIFLRNIM
jgi:hypothetical protein